MIGEVEVLRALVEECLDDDPAVRPTIAAVCERILVNKDVYMKEPRQDVITLHHEIEQLRNDNKQLRSENERKDNTILIGQQRVTIEQMSSTRKTPTQQGSSSQLSRVSMLRIEAPPLMPALTSGRYHVKWTQLADLPAPLYDARVAVQHHKIYVTGGKGPVDDAKHQVYVYNINTDQWDQLPLSGHYFGIPHIIGGRLAIIGGCLSATDKMTNKISTFDEDSQTWSSYYPDLLSVRSRPGVVSHLEHVIVAGGVRYAAKDDNTPVVRDDIEVLNWIENSHWRKLSIKLPVPMYAFTPTISDGDLIIVGYADTNLITKSTYKIPVTNIIVSVDQQHNIDTPTKWTELTAADHDLTALVPSSSPPVVVGGHDKMGTIPTADIKM